MRSEGGSENKINSTVGKFFCVLLKKIIMPQQSESHTGVGLKKWGVLAEKLKFKEVFWINFEKS